MRAYLACVLSFSTLSMACGTVGFRSAVVPRVHAGATVRVEASAPSSGRVAIVEQAPGQGFILNAPAPAPTVPLPGFGIDDQASISAGAVATHLEGALPGFGAELDADARSTCCGGYHPVAMRQPAPHGGASPVAVDADPSDTNAGATVEGSGVASSGVAGSGVVAFEAAAGVPRDGVWAIDGRLTALSALVERGVQVDGIVVRLSDLAGLADLDLGSPESARVDGTDGALDAWAELEHDAVPVRGGDTRVVVRVRGRDPRGAPRGRLRVHLVIDRSSSMQRTWPRVLEAARMLVRRLRADDEIHIVAYGSRATEAHELGRVGDGASALDALGSIDVGGGTHIEAGLRMAYAAAARADSSTRGLVILLSDGVPTHGAFDAGELGGLADMAARQSGCTTSVIGLGTEFDARLLRRVARAGRGGYHVSASADALARSLVTELEAHARAAARRVSLRVSLPAGAELVDFEDGEAGAARVDGGVALDLPSLDAGEERRLVVRVRLPASSRAGLAARVELEYSGLGGTRVRAQRALTVSRGPDYVAREGAVAVSAVLDAHLASALDAAGEAVLRGDVDAGAPLEAHAELLEGRSEHARIESVAVRARVARRLGSALEALLPRATHPQRRQVALALGGLAVELGR